MRAPHRRVLAVAAPVVVTLMLAVSSVGHAQDDTEGPAPPPSPFCAVLTLDEVAAALAVPLQQGTSSETDCSYDADPDAPNADPGFADISLNARREDGPLDDEYPRSIYPEGKDLDVDGHAAYYSADETILFVDEGANDQLFVLQLFGTAPDGVDVQTALTDLAHTGLPRLAAIPMPVEPTEVPEPSYFGDAELAALIPTEIGGIEVDTQTYSSADILAQEDPTNTEAIDALRAAVGTQGKTVDDVSMADATFATEELFVSITGVRVKGADMAAMADQLMPLFLTDVLDPQQTPSTVAGKNVIIYSDGPLESGSPDPSADPDFFDVGRAYVYPKGEVLWIVAAEEPALTEVFQKLP